MTFAVPNFMRAAAFRASALACALVLSAPAAAAQEAAAPLPPGQATPVAQPPAAFAEQKPSARTAPRAPVPKAPQPAAAPAQAPRPAQPAAPAAPPRVVTVVHRLSGWKLLAWLAASGPAFEIDELPSSSDVLTNVVAGFVSRDNKTVVARLPRAEAELEPTPSPASAPGFFAGQSVQSPEQSGFTLVTSDGRRIPAKFIGLDAPTGLSMLEAAEPLVAPGAHPFGDEGDTEDPSVGQTVKLYAPALLEATQTPAARPAPPAAGYVYMSIFQTEGKLTEIKRAPSGKPSEVVARAASATPAWTGAIATDGEGSVLGIVSRSGSGETQIVPVQTMRLALERVLARGASVPQPWLGARGDAAYRTAIELWEKKGWRPEKAMPFIREGRGVLLTSVAPGTPAATAGLRPGDVVWRVGDRDVRGVEDLSSVIQEAGAGSTLDFTVWRSFETEPLKFAVELRGSQNPALATADRELSAARARLRALNADVQSYKLELQRLKGSARTSDEAALAEMSSRVRAAEESIAEVLRQVTEAEMRVAEAAARGEWSARFSHAPAPPGPAAPSPLQSFGLRAVGLTPRSAARLGASGGALVLSVRPESQAAGAGLRAGDVVETINGRRFSLLDLRRLLRNPGAGTLTLVVVRDRKRQIVTLPPAPEPPRQP
ncbi:MAG TPA: PDZ domain-containing protein [Pyrinomonadaceae bacterium]|nr:PDZ domain-containing protein [Pyrinomonadaceae bacterium]